MANVSPAPASTIPANDVNSNPACSANVCNNHGICEKVGYGTGIQCFCSSGWSGSRCQYSKLLRRDIFDIVFD